MPDTTMQDQTTEHSTDQTAPFTETAVVAVAQEPAPVATPSAHRSVVKIRRLRVRDLKLLTEIFDKNLASIGEESLRKLISSKATATPVHADSTDIETSSVEETIGETVLTIGTTVLSKLAKVFNEDVAELFASLLSTTVEEYENMDIDTPCIIIDQIANAEEVQGFFMMSSLTSKATSMFEKPLRKITGWYDSTLKAVETDS